jgi:hypothetical protein
MIHMRRESPSRTAPGPALIPRNHIAEGVVLDPHVPAFAQLRNDRIAHRILVERRGWLLEERTDHAK